MVAAGLGAESGVGIAAADTGELLDARLADTFYCDLLEELSLPCQRHDSAHDLVAAAIAQALPPPGLKGRLPNF